MKNTKFVDLFGSSCNKSGLKINSFAGIKVIAILLIVIWHSDVPRMFGIDFGARMCELFFVISGFLVAYNFSNKSKFQMDKISPNTYLYNKIIKMWPLHIIMLLLYVYLNRFNIVNTFSEKTIISFLLNLFLLQAWIPNSEVYFGFNGVSWFLSAILFCYYLAPLFQKVIQSKKSSIILFFSLFFIRYIIEYLCVNYYGYFFTFSIHTSPIIRVLEFFMGMALVPSFIFLKEKSKILNKFHNHLIYSILEFVICVLTWFIMLKYNNTWFRANFVLLFCFLVFIFAFDNGFISRILGLTFFQKINNFQFEIFLSHNVIMSIWFKLHTKLFPQWIIPWQYNIYIELGLILVGCWIYHKFIDKHATKITDFLLRKMVRIFK